MRRVSPSPELLGYLRGLATPAAPAVGMQTALSARPRRPAAVGIGVVALVVVLAGLLLVVGVSWGSPPSREHVDSGGPDSGIAQESDAGMTSASNGILSRPSEPSPALAASGDSNLAVPPPPPIALAQDTVPVPRPNRADSVHHGRSPDRTHEWIWFALAALALVQLATIVGGPLMRRVSRDRAGRKRAEDLCIHRGNGVSAPPHLAAASVRGKVREKNEDRSAAFVVGDAEVLLVADGLGGLPSGGEAAEIAVRAAEESLRRSLPTALAGGAEAARALVAETIWTAARELALAGARAGYNGDRDGLRSTLIIVIALRGQYVLGYIGDGAVSVLREDGRVDTLLVPQKGEAANILNASLGPRTEGDPIVRLARRSPHDLLLCTSDGIADRVPDTFPSAVRRVLEEEQGDVGRTVERVLAVLADREDAVGPIFDDNLTLGLIVTPGLAGARPTTPRTALPSEERDGVSAH